MDAGVGPPCGQAASLPRYPHGTLNPPGGWRVKHRCSAGDLLRAESVNLNEAPLSGIY
jgi:hypothetical protein